VPHYYFDLWDEAGLIRDDEGQELADEAAGRREAVRSARSIMCEEILNGRMDLRARIEVRGSDGPLFALWFGEAVDVRTG
jgi:hypothetical protein